MKNTLPVVLIWSLLVASPIALAGTAHAADSKEHHWDAAKMQKKLGLSDDQVTKLNSVMQAEKDTMKPLWDKQKELMKKLDEQVKAKAADADIQTTLDSMKANQKAMMDQREQFQSQKAGILTPTQQAKMMLKHMKHMHHGDKDHKEGKENG
jgi:Spy/CpxP family protein refolding chaperone